MTRKKSKGRARDDDSRVQAAQRLSEGWQEIARFARLTPQQRNEESRAEPTPLPYMVDSMWISKRASEELGRAAYLLFDPSRSFHRETWILEFMRVAVRHGFQRVADEAYALPAATELVGEVIEACEHRRHRYWHYFVVYLFGDSAATAFNIGPVRVMKGSDVPQFIESHGDAQPRTASDQEDIQKLARHEWVAAVEIPLSDIPYGHDRAKRVVKLAVLGLGILLADEEFPMRMRVDDDMMPASHTMRFAERDGRFFAGSRAYRPGIHGESGFAKEFLDAFSKQIGWLGECLAAYTEGIGAHSKIGEQWLSALFWYGLARDETDDFAAVVNYGAALDTVLGEGLSRTPTIKEALSALFGMKEEDILIKFPDLTLGQVVEEIYSEGRSRALHGSIPLLSTDFAGMRARAQTITRFALFEMAERIATYSAKYSVDDWSTFRRWLLLPKSEA